MFLLDFSIFALLSSVDAGKIEWDLVYIDCLRVYYTLRKKVPSVSLVISLIMIEAMQQWHHLKPKDSLSDELSMQSSLDCSHLSLTPPAKGIEQRWGQFMLSDSIPCIIGSFFWHSDGWTFTFNSFLFSDSSKKSQKRSVFMTMTCSEESWIWLLNRTLKRHTGDKLDFLEAVFVYCIYTHCNLL